MMSKNESLIVDGKRHEFVWHGPSPEEAPTLVFLHEGLGCVTMWRDFPARLSAATGCSALVYSRSGYGRSDPCALPRPIHFMHHEGQKILPELIKLTGIRQCILVGHSDGGSIAIIYAGNKTAIPLLGLITESAHVFCEEKTVQSIRRTREMFKNGNLRSKLQKYHGDNIDCAFWGWNDVWLDPDFKHWNLEEYVPGIKVPMLVIQGEDDEYGSPAQVESISRFAGAAEVLMLSNCRHNPHQEQEVAVFEAMKNFICRIKDH
ncbi:MAG: alpha/beta hydrolase [Deltaproteobacteria bacterium]|jgi:pimeloyl-ACP methyl ester carboxylesterase|nr:alpha/beta hydrolase [Deltaproteobacteria bacterium]MBT4088197.1 alpha/beta hydrolase [Deltaproteobacteria bacterium]MBT4265005.1 alpha/beta hydrolase [Deltaproteobacteria bacterium]MBT6501183.1 alpha/beta hydrolase [Deltaproteobacteria bacterium]MBT6615774.1 alpha/beta hydrolase [Deltaproteobacteria bacterium]